MNEGDRRQEAGEGRWLTQHPQAPDPRNRVLRLNPIQLD